MVTQDLVADLYLPPDELNHLLEALPTWYSKLPQDIRNVLVALKEGNSNTLISSTLVKLGNVILISKKPENIATSDLTRVQGVVSFFDIEFTKPQPAHPFRIEFKPAELKTLEGIIRTVEYCKKKNFTPSLKDFIALVQSPQPTLGLKERPELLKHAVEIERQFSLLVSKIQYPAALQLVKKLIHSGRYQEISTWFWEAAQTQPEQTSALLDFLANEKHWATYQQLCEHFDMPALAAKLPEEALASLKLVLEKPTFMQNLKWFKKTFPKTWNAIEQNLSERDQFLEKLIFLRSDILLEKNFMPANHVLSVNADDARPVLGQVFPIDPTLFESFNEKTRQTFLSEILEKLHKKTPISSPDILEKPRTTFSNKDGVQQVFDFAKPSLEDIDKLLDLLRISKELPTKKLEAIKVYLIKESEASPSKTFDLIEGIWNNSHFLTYPKGLLQKPNKNSLKSIDELLMAADQNRQMYLAAAQWTPDGRFIDQGCSIDAILYQAHAEIEKLLKILLYILGEEIQKTHSLTKLLFSIQNTGVFEKCPSDWHTDAFYENVEWLGPYAVEKRYKPSENFPDLSANNILVLSGIGLAKRIRGSVEPIARLLKNVN